MLSILTVWLGPVVLLLAALWVSYSLGRKRGRLEYQSVLQESLATGQSLGETLQRAMSQNASLVTQAEALERKANGYFGVIKIAQDERDRWMTLWRSESVAHGNAQMYLLEILNRFSLLLKKHNISAPVPPFIEQLIEEHRSQYVTPASSEMVPTLANVEAISAARPATMPPGHSPVGAGQIMSQAENQGKVNG
jgi:hypothetical protein